jgi:hypothetical protein
MGGLPWSLMSTSWSLSAGGGCIYKRLRAKYPFVYQLALYQMGGGCIGSLAAMCPCENGALDHTSTDSSIWIACRGYGRAQLARTVGTTADMPHLGIAAARQIYAAPSVIGAVVALAWALVEASSCMGRKPWQDPDLWTCPVNPHLMHIGCNIYLFIYSWAALLLSPEWALLGSSPRKGRMSRLVISE